MILSLYIVFFLVAVGLFRQLLFSLWVQQTKEYRIDRLRDFFSINEQRARYLGVIFWYKLALLLFFILQSKYFDASLNLLFAIMILLYIVQLVRDVFQVYVRGLERPRFTVKILLMLFLNAGAFLYLAYYYVLLHDSVDVLFRLLILDITFVVIPLVVMVLLKPVTYLSKAFIIWRAKQKMAQYPDLVVIGVTGSYGKTSTKDFIGRLLEEKYATLVTPGHVNTDIGVAHVVLKQLRPEHQVFVVEMGAYKRGEIKAICDIVKPRIGVLTSINNQHISLFGNQDNIVRGKFELMKALPKDGVAVINRDNKHIRAHMHDIPCPNVTVSLEAQKSNVFARKIKSDHNKLTFEASVFGESIACSVNVVGKHMVLNVLMAVAVAHKLGVSKEAIQRATRTLSSPEGGLVLYEGKNGLEIVSDVYNSNVDGVKAAVDFITEDESIEKIVVFSRLWELGDDAHAAHEDLLIYMRDKGVNSVYISRFDHFILFRDVVNDIHLEGLNVHVYDNFHEAADEILKIGKKGIVLCEGRRSRHIFNLLKK